MLITLFSRVVALLALGNAWRTRYQPSEDYLAWWSEGYLASRLNLDGSPRAA